MDRTIVVLSEEEKEEKLVEVLNKLKNEELATLVDNRALRGRGETVPLVRAILHGSPCTNSLGTERRMFIFQHSIQLLHSQELNSKVASELVGLLMLETDAFPAVCLADLASIFVEGVKNGTGSGKSLELFPQILSALAVQESVVVGGNQMTGSEYKSHVLNRLCSGRWDPESVIHLAAMFKDITLTTEELNHVVNKITRMFSDLDLQELPPLVYQLLLLSAKGHKKLVLEGVTLFFIEQDNVCRNQSKESDLEDTITETITNVDQLRHVEGTIILHITFAIKQDHALGREFIKYLKAYQQSDASKVLSPFNIALALSVARIHCFEEQIYDFLKSSILKSFKDEEKQQDSAWVREIVPDTCDIHNLLLETVQNSKYGWDHVTQGLVSLGFLLMDAFGPKGAFGRVPVAPSVHVTPSSKACLLGAKILKDTFKAHEMVRVEILEQILNRVVTKATAPVSHYLDLLSSTVSSAPQILLDSLPKVREAFDYLAYLPPPSALGLMRAVQPLMKISMNLKDALMLVLRKAMFSRQVEARRIAVSGYLMILRHFKVLGSLPTSQASCSQSFSSQVQVDVHVQFNSSTNEALCLEILGSLRRSLTQQAEVRMELYEGLFDVASRNTNLCQPILGALLSHLRKYYEKEEDVNPPIKLEPCVKSEGDKVLPLEPLAHLLSCIQQCLVQASRSRHDEEDDDDDDDEEGCIRELEDMMESLTRRMIKSELEDFELDKSADFSTGTGVGIKNNIFALLVLGVYEVLIEHNFTAAVDLSVETCEVVLQLFENFRKVSDILKEKSSSGGGKKGKSSGSKPARSLLSIKGLTLMLHAIYSDTIPSHQEALKTLRANVEFTKFIVSVAVQKLQQVNERGVCDGAEGQDKAKVFKYCCQITRIFMQQYALSIESQEKREKSKSLNLQYLEGVSVAMSLACTHYRDKLQDFLLASDINKSEEGDENAVAEEDLVHCLIKRFQRLILSVVAADDEEDRSMKEVVTMVSVMAVLSKQLRPEGEQLQQQQGWIQRICAEQNLDDSSASKALLVLLLSLTSQVKNSSALVRDLAQDIHSQLGDIDQEVEVEDTTHYALINPRTAAPCVLSLVLSHLDHEMEDTDWVINRMRADLAVSPQPMGDAASTQAEEKYEKSVCGRLGFFIGAFHELVQSAVPITCTEVMLKTVTRLYTTLTLMVKFYLSKYSQKCGGLTTRFEKLVKMSGTHLTQNVYAMITYMQASQSEHLQQSVEKGKRKDKQKAGGAAPAPGQAKVLKETKSIPNLIFGIEQYERYLIQLTKKSKVNLMEHFKLSTSRDFRINSATLQAALEQQETSSDESESDDGDNDDDNEDEENNPPNKKSKLDDSVAAAKKGKLGLKGKKKGKGASAE